MNKAQTIVLIQFILFIIIGGAVLLLSTHPSLAQRIVGAIVLLVGLAIGFGAMFEHRRVNQGGPNAVPTPRQDAELITSGLYKYIAIRFIQAF